MKTSVYLEMSEFNASLWYIWHCNTQKVLHEIFGRDLALKVCQESDYHIEYELWPRKVNCSQIDLQLQSPVEAGALTVRYKESNQVIYQQTSPDQKRYAWIILNPNGAGPYRMFCISPRTNAGRGTIYTSLLEATQAVDMWVES